MSAALDGELSAPERRELDAHLDNCPACAQLFRELAGQSCLLRALDCEVPEGLSGRILAALPEQKSAKKSPLVLLRRWGTLAACLVLAAVGAVTLSGPLKEAGTKGDAAPMSLAEDPAPRASSITEAVESDAAGETPAPQPVPSSAPALATNGNEVREKQAAGPTLSVSYHRADWSEDLTAEGWLVDDEGDLAALLEQYPDSLSADTDLTQARFIAVVLTENSGSISHTVERLEVYPGGYNVVITRHVPEVGTCDMAAWLILIQLEPAPAGDDVVSLTIQ